MLGKIRPRLILSFIRGGLRRGTLLAVLPLLILSGCAPSAHLMGDVDTWITQGRYDQADQLVEQNLSQYGENNLVLYCMDRGMLLHLAGRYKESNSFLAKAEKRIDELYTKSLSAQAGAFLTNDNLLPYEGEDFEKVMIHLIAALNYTYLGEWDGALVEARKVDHKLTLLNQRHQKGNTYREDAFARYLSGILYEARGEVNEAFIDYRKAHDIYLDYQKAYGTPVPPTLSSDLLRTTEALGLSEEHQYYKELFPGISWTGYIDLRQQGELIFISYDGLSPVKTDTFIDAYIPEKQVTVREDDDHDEQEKVETTKLKPVRLALPKFVPRPSRIAYGELKLLQNGQVAASQKSFLADDISAIAIRNLEEHMGEITLKAIARAAAKYSLSKEVENKTKDNPYSWLFGIASDLYPVLSEQSDKRSWRTLPGQIRMARITVPPGEYAVIAEYYSPQGQLLTKKEYAITLRAGEKKIIHNRAI